MKIMNGLDLQSQKITNLADPSTGTDAANMQYVDNVARGLKWKEPVRAASTANVTVASPGTTIDGVTLASGNRVLLKNQSTGAENGIYVWTASGSPMTRSTDADTTGDMVPGTAVSVTEGTVNADKVYMITSDTTPIIPGTTATTWGILGGGTTYSGGNGIGIAGSVISAVADPASGAGIVVGAGGISVDPSVVARKYSANVGNGSSTSIAVVHNLGTKDVSVTTRLNSDDAAFITDWVATSTSTITLTFAVAPASSAVRVTVIG